MPETAYPIVPASAALRAPRTLLERCRVDVINPLIWSNAEGAEARRLHQQNVARIVEQPAVLLGCYEDALVDPAFPFAVFTSAGLIAEHAPPDLPSPARVAASRRRAETVGLTTVFACHRGSRTWGHWLGDVLPKIVLAERHAPDQFRYLIPEDTLKGGRFAEAVHETLAAYGIPGERLLPLRAGHPLRFTSLFDIACLVEDGIHPGALAAMQSGARLPARSPYAGRPVALLRRPSDSRALANDTDIRDVLAGEGFILPDSASLPFADQAALFRDAAMIAGDLGSNLAASLFCPPSARLLTFAPSGWTDFWLVNRFQRLGIIHADARGRSADPARIDTAPYALDTASLREGLAVLRAADPHERAFSVAGRVIPRAPGAVVWELHFGAKNCPVALLHGAWSPPEPDFTWSLGASAMMSLPGGGSRLPAGRDFWLEIDGCGLVAPGLTERPFGVAVNGGPPVWFSHDTLTHLYVPVRGEAARNTPDLRLEFHHPICPSPLELGLSDDSRPLGFCFKRIALRLA